MMRNRKKRNMISKTNQMKNRNLVNLKLILKIIMTNKTNNSYMSLDNSLFKIQKQHQNKITEEEI
jgi:hypothetical protein